MTRVKICGITRERDLERAVDAGADAVGVVCDVPIETPRSVSTARATELVAATPPFVTAVLVTMPAGPERAIELVEAVEPDAVQIHGEMRPGDLAYVRAKVDARVMLAVGADRVDTAGIYDDVVDALVVDSVGDDGGGGTGETHDWERTHAATASLSSPVVLAGGLTPENVSGAVETVSPFAVDVASGVEAEGGVKDGAAVRSFVARAKRGRHPVEP
ncbi:phosphoribosylanthranilate isomerase [Natrononativus amylolyticus]|uniref:phosphoribosylanthranilate isomerase n=1 Tax=Natrononativus amylolyticus TaxID=2963434 RepID=UPI0020CE2DDA|nr:phosphoribosylanthranilate isomerase [Natrononativus amylolyticus]